LTSELILKTIQFESDKLNLRPAIIKQFLSNLNTQSKSVIPVGILGTKLSEALDEIISKMDQESTVDFMLALESLQNQRSFLKTLRVLAEGTTRGSELFDEAHKNDAILAALLCGQKRLHRHLFSQLLPPYAYLCKELITSENGNIALNLSKFRQFRSVTLSELFFEMMKTCAECHFMFSSKERSTLSESVVQVLFQYGIHAQDSAGIPIAVRSVFDHPLLEALHETSLADNTSQFKHELDAYMEWKLRGARTSVPRTSLPVGMQVLKDLRNFQSHILRHAKRLLMNGWPLQMLERLANVFANFLRQSKVEHFMSEAGYPVVTQEAIDRAKKKRSRPENRPVY
jgi:hypothetical protein